MINQIVQLEGLQRGQRADGVGKVSSISVKTLKGGKAAGLMAACFPKMMR